MDTAALLPAAATALLARLHIPIPRNGKLDASTVQRALENVPHSRRSHALADLKWQGLVAA
jgi:hypothetical protein